MSRRVHLIKQLERSVLESERLRPALPFVIPLPSTPVSASATAFAIRSTFDGHVVCGLSIDPSSSSFFVQMDGVGSGLWRPSKTQTHATDPERERALNPTSHQKRTGSEMVVDFLARQLMEGAQAYEHCLSKVGRSSKACY